MMDGELEQLAIDEVDLTEVARQALNEEMSSRGLSQHAPQPNASAAPLLLHNNSENEDKLCVARRFTSFAEALVARSLLNHSGISCHLADENMLGGNPILSNALGGVRLFVRESELSEASALLNEPIPDSIEVPGLGNFVQPRCPQCGSLDVAFGELNDAAKISLPLGLPLPIRPHDWLCHKCGCRWSDSEQE
ncbi:MAG TPA: DUF2007 domain-containing protein [Terriglobales bacterium]|nr:DUF2007 domain-containing protein [Terriglobales bacterium]